MFLFVPMARQPLVGLLNIEASHSHSDTPHSLALLWTSDRPDVETSTCQHTTLTRDLHPCPRRDSNPQFQQASGHVYKYNSILLKMEPRAYSCLVGDVRLEVLRVVMMKIQVFWDVMPCRPVNCYQNCEALLCLTLQGQAAPYDSTLLDREDEGTTVLRNIGNTFPVDTA